MEENNLQQPVPQAPIPEQPLPQMPPLGQPVYSPIPPVTGEGEKKKGKGILIGVILAVVVILLAIAGILAYKLFVDTPERRLQRGLANLVKEMEAYGNPISREIDFETIMENMTTGATTLEISLNVTVGEENDTVGVDFTRNYDYPNKLMEADFAISAYNIDFINGNLIAEDDILYISMPKLMQDTYFLDLGHFGQDYNASEWAWQFGYDVEEDASLNLFPEEGEEGDDKDLALAEDLTKVFYKNLEQISSTMVVEDSGTAVEIERGGKTITCNGIRVVLDKDAVNQLLEELEEVIADSIYAENTQEVFALRLQKDLELYFYLDSRDRIVNIATQDRIKLKNTPIETIGFSFVFSGEERTLDQVTGTCKLADAETEVAISVDRQAELGKDTMEDIWKLGFTEESSDIELDMTYSAAWNLAAQDFVINLDLEGDGDTASVELEGIYEDITKGEGFTLHIGKLNISADGEVLLKISGRIGVSPFEGTITAPTGARDLFALSEDEFEALVMEIYESAFSYNW